MSDKYKEWLIDYCDKNITHPDRREVFEAGAQSRQAEIDELQAMCEKQGLYAFELQKRIDEALRHVVDHGGYDDLTHVIDILKGNQNEN